MYLTTQAVAKLIDLMKTSYPSYGIVDLFKIRGALHLLYFYDLADTDLLIEVEKAIKDYENREICL